jgi:hypothetical protein
MFLSNYSFHLTCTCGTHEVTVEKSLRQWQTEIACLGCLFLSLCVPDSRRKFSLVTGCTELFLSELETLLLSLSVLDVSL